MYSNYIDAKLIEGSVLVRKWANSNVQPYVIAGSPEAEPTPTPSPTPVPSETPITQNEYILIILWIVFIAIAFITQQPLAYAISGFITLLLALDLGIIYIDNTGEWMFGVIAFALGLFSFFLMIAAVTTNKGIKAK
jgi:hypothetical protein